MRKKRELFIGLIAFMFLFCVAYITSANQLTLQTVQGPYPGTVSAGELDFSWTAGSIVSTTFSCTGNELLLVHNTSVSAATFTLNSVADEYGRTGDISEYSLAAGDYAAFKITNTVGWRNSSGIATMSVSDASVEVALLDISR